MLSMQTNRRKRTIICTKCEVPVSKYAQDYDNSHGNSARTPVDPTAVLSILREEKSVLLYIHRSPRHRVSLEIAPGIDDALGIFIIIINTELAQAL